MSRRNGLIALAVGAGVVAVILGLWAFDGGDRGDDGLEVGTSSLDAFPTRGEEADNGALVERAAAAWRDASTSEVADHEHPGDEIELLWAGELSGRGYLGDWVVVLRSDAAIATVGERDESGAPSGDPELNGVHRLAFEELEAPVLPAALDLHLLAEPAPSEVPIAVPAMSNEALGDDGEVPPYVGPGVPQRAELSDGLLQLSGGPTAVRRGGGQANLLLLGTDAAPAIALRVGEGLPRLWSLISGHYSSGATIAAIVSGVEERLALGADGDEDPPLFEGSASLLARVDLPGDPIGVVVEVRSGWGVGSRQVGLARWTPPPADRPLLYRPEADDSEAPFPGLVGDKLVALIGSGPGDVDDSDPELDNTQPTLVATWMDAGPGSATPYLLVAGDSSVAELDIRVGSDRVEVDGGSAVLDRVGGRPIAGEATPPVVVAGFERDGTVVPAFPPRHDQPAR